jgi:hypothetical protein
MPTSSDSCSPFSGTEFDLLLVQATAVIPYRPSFRMRQRESAALDIAGSEGRGFMLGGEEI